MSEVSIFVPSYRYAHYLRECVESILTQTGVEVRVLIIDDASPDNTPEVAAALVAQDSRVEYRRHATNRGHIATYNEGLAWASGDYTVLLSADDMLTPGSLQRATRVLDAHPDVGFVYGDVLRFTTGKPLPQPRTTTGDCSWEICDGLQWLEERCRLAQNGTVAPEVVVRTSLQKRLGDYRADLPHTADLEMWMRFALHAPVGVITDADQAYYREHQNSMHLAYTDSRRELEQRKHAFDVFFEDFDDRLHNRAYLAGLVRRALARDSVSIACNAIDRGAGRASAYRCIAFGLRMDPKAVLCSKAFALLARVVLGRSGFAWTKIGCRALLGWARPQRRSVLIR